MKFIAAACAMIAAASAVPVADVVAAPLSHEEDFEAFAAYHGKVYTSAQEKSYRAAVFKANVLAIKAHNEAASLSRETFTKKVNKFADMTADEFAAQMTNPRFATSERKRKEVEQAKLGWTDVDWRSKNVVTHVKNQGQCGSCWSFSATGSIEGAHAIATGTLVSLSEQNLVDCSKSYGNQGCNGGLMDDAFQYVIHNGGIEGENSYQYNGADSGACQYSPGLSVATISSYADIRQGDEADLQSAIQSKGPVSIAVDASKWQFYDSGVFNDCSSSASSLDHGVLAVGLTSQGGQQAYIVKNSWGADWGEQGYIRVQANSGACGAAQMASYPIV